MSILSFKNVFYETTGLEYHDVLNPRLFVSDHLKDEINNKLLDYADKFRNFCLIKKENVIDYYMTGGNCNYNYTDKSDIDVHVLVDKDSMGNRLFLDDYFWDKKYIFMINNHDEIAGYTLEPYIQDNKERIPMGQGVYSLLKRQWIQKPVNLHLDFDHNKELNKKINTSMRLIDHSIETNRSADEARKLKKRITDIRALAISKQGEFSIGNLVFKSLRNMGYLDRLDKHIADNKE